MDVVTEGSNPTVCNNCITNNHGPGIRVYAGGSGTFEHNDLRGNYRGPWDVTPDCKITCSDNLK